MRFRIAERLEGRHPNRVSRDGVKRPVPTVLDLCSRVGEEPLRVLDAFDLLLGRFDQGVEGCRQSLTLLRVENRVFLEERDFLLGCLTVLGLVIPLEGAGVNDGRAVLSLLDMAAEFLRLPEGHPDRASVTGDFSRGPKLQDVDSLVGLSVVPQRPGDPAGGVLGIPGLHPRADTLFKLLDDAIGYAERRNQHERIASQRVTVMYRLCRLLLIVATVEMLSAVSIGLAAAGP